MSDPDEFSQSGAPIYRHQKQQDDARPQDSDDTAHDRLIDHITRHLGEPARVYHEIVSTYVHIDIHIIPPREDRPVYTLVTSGMSDRPMQAPPTAEPYRYAEILTCLPPDWPLDDDSLRDNEAFYWPLRWLKTLARLPHEYGTWLWSGHTVPNGDPAQPVADNTDLCCMLVSVPLLCTEDFLTLPISKDKTIHFLSMIPLYREEMALKLQQGTQELYRRFNEIQASELILLNRPNVAL